MASNIVLHAFLNMHQTQKQEIELRHVEIFIEIDVRIAEYKYLQCEYCAYPLGIGRLGEIVGMGVAGICELAATLCAALTKN